MTDAPPVKGFQPLSPDTVGLANHIKEVEEAVMRLVDLAKDTDLDQRWLAIARTHLQEGFMALSRANFKPQRIEGPIDANFAFDEAGKLLQARKTKRPSITDALRATPTEYVTPRDWIVDGGIKADRLKDLATPAVLHSGGFVGVSRSNEVMGSAQAMNEAVCMAGNPEPALGLSNGELTNSNFKGYME